MRHSPFGIIRVAGRCSADPGRMKAISRVVERSTVRQQATVRSDTPGLVLMRIRTLEGLPDSFDEIQGSVIPRFIVLAPLPGGLTLSEILNRWCRRFAPQPPAIGWNPFRIGAKSDYSARLRIPGILRTDVVSSCRYRR